MKNNFLGFFFKVRKYDEINFELFYLCSKIIIFFFLNCVNKDLRVAKDLSDNFLKNGFSFLNFLLSNLIILLFSGLVLLIKLNGVSQLY